MILARMRDGLQFDLGLSFIDKNFPVGFYRMLQRKMCKIKRSITIKCEVKKMATRQSVEQFIQQCEDTLRNAHAQYSEAQQLEHYNDSEFTNAQEQIETTYNDLMHLSASCNAQQREQLNRMRLQLQSLQNDMTLLRH